MVCRVAHCGAVRSPASIGAMALLGDSEIEARLAELSGWEREGEAIVKRFERGDFVGSVKFVDSLVGPAEEMGHHPDLEISWDTVTVRDLDPLRGRPHRGRLRAGGKIDALA